MCRSMDPARDAVTGNGVQSGRQAECLGRPGTKGRTPFQIKTCIPSASAHSFSCGSIAPEIGLSDRSPFLSAAAPSLHHWVGDQSSPKFPIQGAMRHCHLFNGSLLHISIALKLLFDPISKSRMPNIRIRGQPIICLAVQPQKCNFDEGLARGVQIVHS